MSDMIHSLIGTTRRFSEQSIKRLAKNYGFELVGIEYMMPPFDYWDLGRKMFSKLGEFIEESFLRFFSMTLIAVLKKT